MFKYEFDDKIKLDMHIWRNFGIYSLKKKKIFYCAALPHIVDRGCGGRGLLLFCLLDAACVGSAMGNLRRVGEAGTAQISKAGREDRIRLSEIFQTEFQRNSILQDAMHLH